MAHRESPAHRTGSRPRYGYRAVWLVLSAMLIALRTDPVAVSGAGVEAPSPPVYYQAGRPRPLMPSSTELLVQTDPMLRLSAHACIRTLADDLDSARQCLPPNARAFRVKPGIANAVALVRTIPGVTAVRPGYRLTASAPPMFETGDLVVAFQPGTSELQRTEVAADFGLDLPRPVPGLENTVIYRVAGTRRDTVAAAAWLHEHRQVRYAHADFLAPKEAMTIADPLFAQQWHLANTGQGGGDPAADINAPEAWTVTEGAGVTVAVLDGGHQIDHPDLGPALVGAYDYGDGDDNPAGPPHGTSVSGVAIARANDIGVRGVAPQAGWLAMRYGSDAGIAASFALADMFNAVVHTNSWKYSDPSYLPPVVEEAIANALVNGRGGKGLPVVFAAGNDHSPISTQSALATLKAVITVGASTNLDAKADYSNFGAELDLLAPSSGGTLSVTTTDEDSAYTSYFGGTSAAAPQVAGVIALVLAANPDLTAAEVARILEHTAAPLVEAASPAPLVTGHSSWHGHGRLDAAAAVSAAAANVTWPAPVEGLTADDGQTAIVLHWTQPVEPFAAVLVVESRHPMAWAPLDGVTYSIGERPSPGVTVRFVGTGDTLTDAAWPGQHYYAAFVVDENARYSWGLATMGIAAVDATMSESFETDIGDWEHDGPQDSWQFGMPNYFAGPAVAADGLGVCGTNLSGDYGNATTATVTRIASLRSPVLNLAGGNFAYATFADWLAVEGGTFDFARLDVLSASGATLATLLDGYQDNHNEWRRQGVDLSAWSGTNVRLEFSLWANDQYTGPGWYLDDFKLFVGNVPPQPGDDDGDDDVDLDDYLAVFACLSGPSVAPPVGCTPADFDDDGDIDLVDVATFALLFTGG